MLIDFASCFYFIFSLFFHFQLENFLCKVKSNGSAQRTLEPSKGPKPSAESRVNIEYLTFILRVNCSALALLIDWFEL